MKSFIITIALLFAVLTTATAQRTYNLDTITNKPKTEQDLKSKATLTQDTAVYKGTTYPVYLSSKGKKFIIVLSKKGNYYRKYIK